MTDEMIDRAVELAVAARERAYVPYSDFPMGAAVVADNGAAAVGTLIENVSLGLAMCAERVALFSAVTAGLTAKVLALCSDRTDGELTFPCGACLQVALELADADLLVVAVDGEGARATARLSDLIPRGPHRFSPHTLSGNPGSVQK